MASPAEHSKLQPALSQADHADPSRAEVVERLLRSAEREKRAAFAAATRLDHTSEARHHRASARDYAQALDALEQAAARP